MPTDADVFSCTYGEARAKFLQAAGDAGLSVSHFALDLAGHDGEALAVDVARQGPPDAANVLLLTSGVHGIEGYCGSGAQTALMRDAAWAQRADDAGVAVVYVHAVNPYGFSHWRRVTQENVDLNRNFQDFGQPLPSNPAYCKLHPHLLPAAWPPTLGNRAAILGLIATQGIKRLQQAISSGQHERPEGLFFTGTQPTWSQRTLRQVLREQALGAHRLAWIDLHTGLGPCGHCERLLMGAPDDAVAYARADSWWGAKAHLTHAGSDASVSASVVGPAWVAAPQECPQTELTGIYMEFGTQPPLKVLHALRGDQWLQRHPQAPHALARDIKQRMFEAFFIDTPEWKQGVLSEVREAASQALEGLRRDG